MPKTPSVRQWIITLACLCAGAGIAKTADSLHATAAECAARDVKLITLIEDRGEAKDVASDQLAEMAFTMLRARETCHEGRVADAVALYDSVLQAPRFAHAR